jgi:hypothetical protein
MTEMLRPLPAQADATCYAGHVGASCSHVPLSGDAQHVALAGPPHTTRRNHGRCDATALPARRAGARLPILRAGFSSEDQVQLEGGQGQRRTDQLRVSKWQHVPDRLADRLCQSRAFPAGCVPGATDGSMPVGTDSTIYASF